MWPYDYTKENYSTLGYVYEGITTYYGDLMLLRSGVWNWEQYLSSLNSDIQRHYNNSGRFNYSLAESSFDTWLDGYVPGIPARKTSIYIEGLLAALIADIILIKNSDGKYCLDNVMYDLYHGCYAKGKGYSEAEYKLLLEKYAGNSFDLYFKEIIWGKNFFEKYLVELLTNIACSLDLNGKRLTKIVGNQEQEKLFGVWCKND
jgi:predicted metalloprotease with PDZ domain